MPTKESVQHVSSSPPPVRNRHTDDDEAAAEQRHPRQALAQENRRKHDAHDRREIKSDGRANDPDLAAGEIPHHEAGRRGQQTEEPEVQPGQGVREPLGVRRSVECHRKRSVERAVARVGRAPDAERQHHHQRPAERLADRDPGRTAPFVRLVDQNRVTAPRHHRPERHQVAERAQLENHRVVEADQRDSGDRHRRPDPEFANCGLRTPAEDPRQRRSHHGTERHQDRDIARARVVDRAVLQELVAEDAAESHRGEQPLVSPHPSPRPTAATNRGGDIPVAASFPQLPSPQRRPRERKPPDQDLQRRELLQQRSRVDKRDPPDEDHESRRHPSSKTGMHRSSDLRDSTTYEQSASRH